MYCSFQKKIKKNVLFISKKKKKMKNDYFSSPHLAGFELSRGRLHLGFPPRHVVWKSIYMVDDDKHTRPQDRWQTCLYVMHALLVTSFRCERTGIRSFDHINVCFFVIGTGEGVPITGIYCVALDCDGDTWLLSWGFHSRSPAVWLILKMTSIRFQDSVRRVINRRIWSRSQAVQDFRIDSVTWDLLFCTCLEHVNVNCLSVARF